MDKIDLKIIFALSKNARATLKELSDVTDLSNVAIRQRMNKLEEQGTIQGYQASIRYEDLGYRTASYIGVFLERAGLYKKVVAELEKIPEVLEASFTTGNYSLLLKIICRDNRHLMDILSNQVQTIPGIARTETFVILESPIERKLGEGND